MVRPPPQSEAEIDYYERDGHIKWLSDHLAERAKRLRFGASSGRAITIGLGAFIATQAVADRVFGENQAGVLVAYAFAGLLVAALSGLEAAFGNERRSAELLETVALLANKIWAFDSEWSKVLDQSDVRLRADAARALVESQNILIADTYARAAKSGENLIAAATDALRKHPERFRSEDGSLPRGELVH
jgi:hypothetical protein